jgi:hypothetical protein
MVNPRMNSTKAVAAVQNQQLRTKKTQWFCTLMSHVIKNGTEKLTRAMIIDLNTFCEDVAKGVKEAVELNALLMESI